MKKTIEFPKDFVEKNHPHSGLHYTFSIDDKVYVSVLLGTAFYSNGVDTYEMWYFREDEPQGHLTINQINEHLKNNPFQS